MYTLRDEMEFINTCLLSHRVRLTQCARAYAPPFRTDLQAGIGEILSDLEQVSDRLNELVDTLPVPEPTEEDFPVADGDVQTPVDDYLNRKPGFGG